MQSQMHVIPILGPFLQIKKGFTRLMLGFYNSKSHVPVDLCTWVLLGKNKFDFTMFRCCVPRLLAWWFFSLRLIWTPSLERTSVHPCLIFKQWKATLKLQERTKTPTNSRMWYSLCCQPSVTCSTFQQALQSPVMQRLCLSTTSSSVFKVQNGRRRMWHGLLGIICLGFWRACCL